VVSQAGAAAAKKLGVKIVRYIGPMVNIHIFDPAKAHPEVLRSRHNLKGRFVILYPNRLTRLKGALEFIRALHVLVNERGQRNVVAVTIGSSDPAMHKELLAEIKKYGLEKHVIIIDHAIPQEELRDWYAAADVVVLPAILKDLV